MGIIVGSKTWMECDTLGCNEKSAPDFDQTNAREAAYNEGWHKDQNNGKTYCPKCVRKGV